MGTVVVSAAAVMGFTKALLPALIVTEAMAELVVISIIW